MDLTKQPPRRPSNPIMAGIAALARMTDKARAHNDETLGAYLYGETSGLDKEVLEFINMEPEEYAEAAARLDDAALADLVLEKASKTPAQIAAFNKEHLERLPQDERHRQLIVERVAKYAPGRTDVKTVFQSIELDDWGLFRDTDLTTRPPRSPFVRSVIGMVAVARMGDKARASKCGKLGEYKYGEDSGLDKSIIEVLGISPADFAEGAYRNPNDLELAEWVRARTRCTQAQISAFNAKRSARGLHTSETREFFLERRNSVCPDRTDITTFSEILDFEDEKIFGLVDLTRHAPRNPYDTSVGGLVSLGRMIDKARATAKGTQGGYWYGTDSGIDRALLELLGLSQEEFAAGLREHLTDEAVVQWLGLRLQKPQAEIDAFNERMRSYGPTAERGWNFLRGAVANSDPSRTELTTFFAMIVLDDKITFARLRAGV
ncbi:MAG: DUF5069 domain-containing protein [Candidatus Handelsmanbacteria bacterium]|nr:DUF5069 domain-containing protein [Candidatus Handelsmanbacteria bacterium]